MNVYIHPRRSEGYKLRPKFHGPYAVTKMKSHDRYDTKKVKNYEGPINTSTVTDHMKLWAKD